MTMPTSAEMLRFFREMRLIRGLELNVQTGSILSSSFTKVVQKAQKRLSKHKQPVWLQVQNRWRQLTWQSVTEFPGNLLTFSLLRHFSKTSHSVHVCSKDNHSLGTNDKEDFEIVELRVRDSKKLSFSQSERAWGSTIEQRLTRRLAFVVRFAALPSTHPLFSLCFAWTD